MRAYNASNMPWAGGGKVIRSDSVHLALAGDDFFDSRGRLSSTYTSVCGPRRSRCTETPGGLMRLGADRKLLDHLSNSSKSKEAAEWRGWSQHAQVVRERGLS